MFHLMKASSDSAPFWNGCTEVGVDSMLKMHFLFLKLYLYLKWTGKLCSTAKLKSFHFCLSPESSCTLRKTANFLLKPVPVGSLELNFVNKILIQLKLSHSNSSQEQ